MYKGENKNILSNSNGETSSFGSDFDSLEKFGFDREKAGQLAADIKNEERSIDAQDEKAVQYGVVPAEEKGNFDNMAAIRDAITDDNVMKTGEIGKSVRKLADTMMKKDINDPAMLNDGINNLSRALVGDGGVLGGGIRRG